MKDFEQLYCLDKKGKIRTFIIRVAKETAITVLGDTNSYTIISETGLLEGKLTKKITSISKGKQNRTIEEQAVFQAQSKWNDKLDEGYKSDEMCRAEFGFHYKYCVNVMYITTNTNADWNELPMLAEPIKKVKQIPLPAYIQPKLNGVRCLAKLKDGEVLLMSRGGKYYNIPHIQEALKRVFTNWGKPVILDGEIFNKDYNLQDIVGAARRESEVKDKTFLEYHIYDAGMPLPQNERLDLIRTVISGTTNADQCLKLVTTETVTQENQIKEYHDRFVADDYEGAIVRAKYGKYAFGFRDKCLMKVKEFIDEEFVLESCKVTEGKSIGDSFVFQLSNNTNDMSFFARPKGTREQKEEWYNNRDWVTKKATVRYQERTPDGLPHQAHVVIIRDYE